eukprot:6172946-Pleurochrysis_carterae.AAC.1
MITFWVAGHHSDEVIRFVKCSKMTKPFRLTSALPLRSKYANTLRLVIRLLFQQSQPQDLRTEVAQAASAALTRAVGRRHAH